MSRALRILLLSLLTAHALALIGCASPPVAPVDRARTSVILLPDADGRVGSVLVSSAQGQLRLAGAYETSTVGGSAAPARGQTSADAVSGSYGPALAAHPKQPAVFTLYFEIGKAVLKPASRRELPALFAAVSERKPTEITIYGHSDSIGSDRWNTRLSELRARAIERLLRKHDPSLDTIEVKFLGDREPLYPAPDNVPEPRNRRAEVVVL